MRSPLSTVSIVSSAVAALALTFALTSPVESVTEPQPQAQGELVAYTLDDAMTQCRLHLTGNQVPECEDAALTSWCPEFLLADGEEGFDPMVDGICNGQTAPTWAKLLAQMQLDDTINGDCRVNMSPTSGVCAAYLDDTMYYVMFDGGIPGHVSR